MARYADADMVLFNSEMITQALKKKGLTKAAVSQFVLGCSDGYITNCGNDGRIDKAKLEKLCAFLDVPISKVLLGGTGSVAGVTKAQNKNENEMIITGMNVIYEQLSDLNKQIKAQNELMSNLFEEIKSWKMADSEMSKRSTLNLIAGRVKDILEKGGKNENRH